ncbi:hypothetical protein DSO57_1000958 [Entomophthora muscae]|uniref:Uncharacterized protein n=2 Tax=Entomophthora muscae TaxID=34485 RepID=A0ACC2U0P4_9FUNG|nr:hypothetical protein DSO57_1027800 [Entomophthora muscae]KAJ9086698.1 hypothetical protein DSO57_1000958 [Entomophthora muscae]
MAQVPTPAQGPPVVTVTSVQYSDPPPVVVTETKTSYYVEETAPPTSQPSTQTSTRPSAESAPPQNLVVWVVVGVVGVVILVATVAFILRRVGRRTRDPEYPPVLNQMASAPLATAPSPSKSITPNRSHESEAVFLRQLNEP